MPSSGVPLVTCLPRGRVLHPRPGETLLETALREGQPLASSCGSHTVCGDCLVRIVAGAANLTPPGAEELAWRERSGNTSPGRLACAVRVNGPVEITTSYW